MELAKDPVPSLLSLRDPSGSLFDYRGELLRFVNSSGLADVTATLGSETIRKLTRDGRFIESEGVAHGTGIEAPASVGEGVWFRHPRVEFPSYPHEWAPEMLYQAAKLTLEIAKGLLDEGLGLKDATPLNVLFRGSRPVFVDLLSVEKRDPLDPTWAPYAQFVRTFLNPLLVNRYFGIPLDMIFSARRDGLEPAEVYALTPAWRRFTRPFFSMVTVPTWLAGKQYQASDYRKRLVDSPAKAKFVLGAFFNQLESHLEKVRPKSLRSSKWSDYMGAANPYERREFEEKERIVGQWLEAIGPKRTLDVGCNTGHFSRLAARAGARVVAIDYDAVVVGRTWRMASEENLDILPLRVDLSRPSPALGWCNREAKSFIDRAEGAFDSALMLAVIHHLMVGEGIPMPEIAELVSGFVTGHLIVEYVDPCDPTFRRIARGRDELYRGFTPERFERDFSDRFQLVECRPLMRPTRRLYLFKKK